MTKRLILPENDICNHYIDGKSSYWLADKYNCSVPTILKRLGENDIEMRSPKLDLPVDTVCEEYLSGIGATFLGIKYGCDQGTILRRLLENGIVIRTNEDIMKNNNPMTDSDNRDKISRTKIQYHKDHPEVARAHGDKLIRFYKDNPKAAAENGAKIKHFYIDNPEARESARLKSIKRFSIQGAGERLSASLQGQDYDAGEWTGYTNKARPHLLPINQCIQINDRFPGSEGHHITKSVVAFIPNGLHRHIKHNVKTGENMGEMNVLAIQFINGGLET